jgi:protocatechuate 3,4-dioxygenase beta subunit
VRNEESRSTPVISRPVPRPVTRGPQPARLPVAEPGRTGTLPLELVRRDIAGDCPGIPLMLRIRVLDALDGTPVAAAVVDLRHREPTGDGELRGAQVTDAEGYAEFRTVHPGREPGEPVRISASVHVGGYLAGGRTVTYSGPLYVPEQIAGQVAAGLPPTEDPQPTAGGPLHVVPRDRFDLTAGLLATVTVTVGG